jgi:hypothetical protein
LLGAVPFGLGLRDPGGNDGRVGSGVQSRPVANEIGVTLGDDRLERIHGVVRAAGCRRIVG